MDEIGREGGGDGQMEEWDPRDVSFITPPCSLHLFSLFLFPCRSFSLLFLLYTTFFFILFFFPFIHSFILFFQSLSGYFSSSTCLPPTPQHFVLLFFLPSFALYLSVVFFFFFLAVLFRFHHLLWQHSSFLLSIFSPLSLSVFHFHSFSFLPIFAFSPKEEEKNMPPFLLFLSLMDQRGKVGMET